MTTLIGRNQFYVLLTVFALVAIVAVGWVTLAGAQTPEAESNGEHGESMQMTMSADSDDDAGVSYEGPSGIWVNGTGKASAAPDIAVISLGVESIEDTAAEARSEAASAMTGVMTVLTNAGVSVNDVQTNYFNISPRYQSVEVERCDEADEEEAESGSSEASLTTESDAEKTCYRVWESRLIGYSVTNRATVKIRTLQNAGTIIDQVTESAGDLVRINGVSFDIDDRQPLQDEARANAVADLERKAAMLAELSGVKLGPIVYINEGAAYTAPPQPLYARAEALQADSAGSSTSISGGKLEVSTTVQGVFLIAGKAITEPEATPEPEQTEEPATPEATEATN